MKKYFLILSTCLFSSSVWAMNYEVGVSFAKKKNSFDKDNYYDTESTTGSVSMYFSEIIALELSYTEAKSNRFEKPPGGVTIQTYQKTEVLGADLIFVLADRKSMFQPYVKGGAAQLKRSQTTYTSPGNVAVPLDIETAVVPSYGAGLKILLTQGLSIRISYDVWRTPVGGGVITDDSQLRAGLSWML
jgi:hypothetical protein